MPVVSTAAARAVHGLAQGLPEMRQADCRCTAGRSSWGPGASPGSGEQSGDRGTESPEAVVKLKQQPGKTMTISVCQTDSSRVAFIRSCTARTHGTARTRRLNGKLRLGNCRSTFWFLPGRRHSAVPAWWPRESRQ